MSRLFIDLWTDTKFWLDGLDPDDLLSPAEVLAKMNELEDEYA